MQIGLVADSRGDLDALQRACDLLLEKGADRFFFLGGFWYDVDELIARRRNALRGGREYGDDDFLSDVLTFLEKKSDEQQGTVAHRLRKDEAEKFASMFARVPDRDSLAYRDPAVSRVLVELIGDRIACLVADKADLGREDIERATFLVHGASAEPAVVQIGARFFVTPGSLQAKTPSCALLSSTKDGVGFTAFDLSGRELRREALNLAVKRKMTLK